MAQKYKKRKIKRKNKPNLETEMNRKVGLKEPKIDPKWIFKKDRKLVRNKSLFRKPNSKINRIFIKISKFLNKTFFNSYLSSILRKWREIGHDKNLDQKLPTFVVTLWAAEAAN